MVAFPNVKCGAVYGDAFNYWWNQDIRIGVAVAVGIGGKIVGGKEVVDLEELGGSLAMIAGAAGSKILRGFDSTRCRFDGGTRNGNPGARPPRIGVQELVLGHDPL